MIDATVLMGAAAQADEVPRLCYVEGDWAYFTTQPIEKQWGDDWDDAPWEHNAGTPYAYNSHNRELGDAPWNIVKVAWEAPYETPGAWEPNSAYSVEQINRRATPWLTGARFTHEQLPPIWAGMTLGEFVELIHAAHGSVYFPLS